MRKKKFCIAIIFLLIISFSFPAYANNGDTIVHITKSGTKYHSSGCQYLSSSDIEITLAQAYKRGYSACSRCNPPDLNYEESVIKESSPENEDIVKDNMDKIRQSQLESEKREIQKNSYEHNYSSRESADTFYNKMDDVENYDSEHTDTKSWFKKNYGFIILALLIGIPCLKTIIEIIIYERKYSAKKPEPKANPPTEIMAYYTKNGYCYHLSPNCKYLKGTYKAVTYNYIKNRRSPCSRCCKHIEENTN